MRHGPDGPRAVEIRPGARWGVRGIDRLGREANQSLVLGAILRVQS